MQRIEGSKSRGTFKAIFVVCSTSTSSTPKMSYAPPVISSGGATAGAGPAGSEFVAPAAAFTGEGFLAPGPAWGGSGPDAPAPVPTQANIELPPQPQAPAAPTPPAAPQGDAPPPPSPQQQQGISPVLRRKCLLVACNYRGTSAELKGCGNDQVRPSAFVDLFSSLGTFLLTFVLLQETTTTPTTSTTTTTKKHQQ